MKKTPGEKLKDERLLKKWSQQKLADEMHRQYEIKITRASISYWESGDTKNQRPENFFAAAKVLGLSPQWVLDDRGEKYINTQKPSDSAMEIAFDYDKLDDIGKAYISEQMDKAWIESQARARGIEPESVNFLTKKS